jgi:CheY-like chemotaxis protein
MLAAVYPTLQSAVLLCIDDNEDVLECEKSFLESFGYSVLTAASGGETALERAIPSLRPRPDKVPVGR